MKCADCPLVQHGNWYGGNSHFEISCLIGGTLFALTHEEAKMLPADAIIDAWVEITDERWWHHRIERTSLYWVLPKWWDPTPFEHFVIRWLLNGQECVATRNELMDHAVHLNDYAHETRKRAMNEFREAQDSQRKAAACWRALEQLETEANE